MWILINARQAGVPVRTNGRQSTGHHFMSALLEARYLANGQPIQHTNSIQV
jgi:hypothetical protein